MNSIKILFLIFLLFDFIYLSVNQLNSRCGYPGKPYRAKLEPENYKLQYNEGEEVTYQCTDFWSYVQTRRCEKGKWIGSPARCGDFVTGILMKDSRMEDISERDRPIQIFEYKNMTIVNTNWKYPNVFTSNRFPTARLRVFDTKKYKWSFNFTGPAVKLFVRVMFNFINHTLLSQELKDKFAFNISVNVGPHRECRLIHQSEDIWRQNGRRTDTDFICDSLSPEDFKEEIANPGDYLYMETQASIDIPHDFIALFFGKSYGNEVEPLCGEPEVSISQLSKFNVQHKDYIIDCKHERYKYIPSKNDIIPKTSHHVIKCGPDMKWNGSYPECLPKEPCPIEQLGTGNVVASFDGLYFSSFNQSVYYAVEGTEVNYVCENSRTDILVGKENIVCQKNGLWTGKEPHCYNRNESSKFPVWLLIGILFCALIFIVCLIAILFNVYTKHMKKRLTKEMTKQNRVENEKNDFYDDIDISGDNKHYDNPYAVIEDEEVRYADPYYNTERPILQSSDSYWRLPNIVPSYLEMIGSNKTSPCPSIKQFPSEQQIYVKED